MKLCIAGASVAALACLSLAMPEIPAGANQISPPHPPRQRTNAAALRGFPAMRHRQSGSSEACAENSSAAPAPAYFVGIPSVDPPDIAGGEDSAVLGGTGNAACDTDAGIGAGTGNAIYGNGGSSFVAAGIDNAITGPIGGSFVGAGALAGISGAGSFVGAGDIAYVFANGLTIANQISGDDSFIGAGDLNGIAGNGSFIGAGGYTYVEGGGAQTGISNQISGDDSFIGAGDRNTVSGNESFLGSGFLNTAAASQAFLGGGYLNAIAAPAAFSAIAGGNSNVAISPYDAIGGGYDNVAKGADATIPGGQRNEAYGELSFAAGYQAHALYTGSFVWSDYKAGSAPLADSAPGQFLVRASGGTTIYSNEADTSGVKLAAGSGAWSSLSDRNAKTDVVPLDDASILSKVAHLPVTAWRYKTEMGVRHAGPMAQDFFAAFGVGEDDRHITSIDEDGIALAAIKGLDAKLNRDDQHLRGLVGALQARIAALEARGKR